MVVKGNVRTAIVANAVVEGKPLSEAPFQRRPAQEKTRKLED